jgi:hypothetical protein
MARTALLAAQVNALHQLLESKHSSSDDTMAELEDTQIMLRQTSVQVVLLRKEVQKLQFDNEALVVELRELRRVLMRQAAESFTGTPVGSATPIFYPSASKRHRRSYRCSVLSTVLLATISVILLLGRMRGFVLGDLTELFTWLYHA